MNLDLRIPMGLMFTLVGIILTAFGIATRSNTELYARSLGINANLWWGIVLLIFGQIMFQMGRPLPGTAFKASATGAGYGYRGSPRTLSEPAHLTPVPLESACSDNRTCNSGTDRVHPLRARRKHHPVPLSPQAW